MNPGLFAASAGTTGATTFDFGVAGQQSEIWVGANGGQIVGSTINTAHAGS